MSAFVELVSMCKAGVYLSVNAHRDCYTTIESFLKERDEEVAPEMLRKMVARDSLVEVQAYSDTPVGSFVIWHYDVDHAIEDMIATIRADRA